MHFTFAYLKKAFDCGLWDVFPVGLRKLGVDDWLVRLVESLYKNDQSRDWVNGSVSDDFLVQVGLHQGAVL